VKRIAVVLSVVFVLLFAAITLFKGRSSEDVAQTEPASPETTDRELVMEFWQAYRTATQYRTAGSIQEAAAEYGRALELNPDHEDALYYAGSMHFELGQFHEAEEAWRHLTQVNPGGSRGYSRLGDLYFCFEQRDFFDPASAQELFERALEINSEETGPLLRLGQIALVRGDAKRAAEYLDAVTASNFKSVPAYFFKGHLAWRSGDFAEAERQFRLATLHDQPVEPVEGVLSEGDTRSGKAILAAMGQCQSFNAFAAGLPDPDDPDLQSKMRQRYSELTAFLERSR
jgi:tetratricopeptide (TPR) repeat protein